MKDNKIIRADGKVLNAGGCCASKPRKNIPVYSATRYKVSQLPKKVDLRPYMTAIEDQGQLGSCTANATVGAVEYLFKTKANVELDASRLFVYYNAREIEGTEDEDSGSAICDAVESLQKIGICSEDHWPYDVNMAFTRPDDTCYEAANEVRISDVKKIKVQLDEFKKVLAEGKPIIFGMALFDSFDRQRKKGFVPMPSKNETARAEHSGHAMLCVGYSDVDEVFIVRNSWGNDWGDNGYCYIPYKYMMNKQFNDGDCWIIDIDENALDLSNFESSGETWNNEDAWSDDDESVLVDLNDEFSNMSDEDWEEFNNALGKYDLPYRLGALFAVACAMDDEISDEETEAAIAHLKRILKIFNYDMSAKRVYSRCLKLATKENFLEETVEILGQYLSPGALCTIAKNMYEIAGADGLDSEEEEFIDALVGAWLDCDEELECNDDDDDDDEDNWDDDDDDDDSYYADDDEWYDDEDDEDEYDDEDDEDDEDEDDEDEYDEDEYDEDDEDEDDEDE